ncbi:restriction endonuclease [Klebsiella pneumoniae]|nr:restriction endonuclease [Klebsiella pneumoniae]
MKKYDEYEVFTERLFRTLTRMHRDVEVKRNVRIDGNQNDVVMYHKMATLNYMTIIECKHYKRRVSKDAYRALCARMAESNASGVMVTTQGFQGGVIAKARKRRDVTLLEVNFARYNVQAVLHLSKRYIESVRYFFDHYAMTSSQKELVSRLMNSKERDGLKVFMPGGDQTTLGDLVNKLEIYEGEGEQHADFQGWYLQLPAPLNENVRIASASYTVRSKLMEGGKMSSSSIPQLKATVKNVITGKVDEYIIDDVFAGEHG